MIHHSLYFYTAKYQKKWKKMDAKNKKIEKMEKNGKNATLDSLSLHKHFFYKKQLFF